ncbi:hypothetical protein C8J57DRAFT_375673 [Mycena rebaudengoi]|nr:hypothetical protein C8J57DRAFT_375673 [Mycena rebaudengoi]
MDRSYFFRALDSTTSAVLAESGEFLVTATPTLPLASITSASSVTNTADLIDDETSGPTATGPSDQSRSKNQILVPQTTFIATIVGITVVGMLAIAILAWRCCVWRRRARDGRPGAMLIEEGHSPTSKIGHESPLPPHQQLSPFPMSPVLAPLRGFSFEQRHPLEGHSDRTVSSDHPSSRDRPSSQYTPSSHHRAYRKMSEDSDRHDRATPRSRAPSQYTRAAQQRAHRKLSEDESYRRAARDYPPPSVHLTPLRAPARGVLSPSARHRFELQLEVETALSETVYDKGEERAETPSKLVSPARRRPLRCMSEPRRNSSESGHGDGADDKATLNEETSTEHSTTVELLKGSSYGYGFCESPR